MTEAPERRLLFVHAHPDDESINNGATMAKYAAEGAHVALVTCTLGEEGEVIPAELAYLAPDRDDALGPYRVDELAAAMRELGVTDHRFLGGAGRYRDSGMMGAPQNDRPGCFWQAPLDEAAGHLVEVIRAVRPQVLVTYDPDGGYGHPDHIKAHRVALRAAELAADPEHRTQAPPHTVGRIFYNRQRRAAAEEGLAALRQAARSRGAAPGGEGEAGAFPGDTDPTGYTGVAELADMAGVVEDDSIDVTVDGGAYAEAKAAAMRAHATQIAVNGPYFALSNGLWQPLLATECYQLVRPADAATEATAALEGDLFAESPGSRPTSAGVPDE